MPRMYGLGLRRAEVLLAITAHERLVKELRWKNRVMSDAPASANFAEGSATRTARGGATGRRLHELAIELAAMSQNGLHYATDRYDIARYERMRQIAAEVLSMVAAAETGAGPSAEDFHRSLLDERGHATPKVDVRAALFDRNERVLLVQEARDRRWTLPGGWADALDTPAQAAAREFLEEAGIAVRITSLVALHDGTRANAHRTDATGSPWHVYKLMFLAERLESSAEEPVAGLDGETVDVGFFDLDALPALSTGRTTHEQLSLMLTAHRDPLRPAVFD
jgi:8-oxo-dGTP pyrophosphatase MutT (NUDIX family)